MKVAFGNWRYLFQNFWYVIPSAILPAVFLALSIDYTAVSHFAHGMVSGAPRAGFISLLRVFSILRIDSWLGGIYSVLTFLSIAFFSAFLLTIVEKHMRIGKRNLRGADVQLFHILLPATGMTFLFIVLYEVWAIIVSAVFFAVCSFHAATLVYIFYGVAFIAAGILFAFIVAALFLWLPCMQVTGFRPYDALISSYHLSSGVRGKLTVIFALFIVLMTAAFGGLALLPAYVLLPVAFVLYAFLFAAFCVRMETVYFYADKIDREDLIRSYREL